MRGRGVSSVWAWGIFNAQRPTPNAQRPRKESDAGRCSDLWKLGVGRWALGVERRRLLVHFLTFTLLTASSFAADPVLNHLSPVAGQQGTTVSVTASGKFDPWPAQVWVDTPGVIFKPG